MIIFDIRYESLATIVRETLFWNFWLLNYVVWTPVVICYTIWLGSGRGLESLVFFSFLATYAWFFISLITAVTGWYDWITYVYNCDATDLNHDQDFYFIIFYTTLSFIE